MMATLTATGRDMAVNMMKKRKPGLAGRMYDVPQIGKLIFIICIKILHYNYRIIIR